MDMNNFSKIKSSLLKSGLPLESMVANSIDNVSLKLKRPILKFGEFFFQRPEASRPHSIDFQFAYDLDIENCDVVEIVFLVECKYSSQGINWFFTNSPLNDAGMEFFLENFFSKGKCNMTNFPSLVPPLSDKTIPTAGKGIEIKPDGDRNDKTITEGIHQLMFATGTSMARAFFKESDQIQVMKKRGIDLVGRSFHSLLCPVLVTTANLRYLENPTIKEIEESKQLEDLGKLEKILVYSTPFPPMHVRNYINKTVIQNVKPLLSSQEEETRAITYLMKWSLLNPSRYYVVNYDEFEDFIEKYINFAAVLLSYACKEVEKVKTELK